MPSTELYLLDKVTKILCLYSFNSRTFVPPLSRIIVQTPESFLLAFARFALQLKSSVWFRVILPFPWLTIKSIIRFQSSETVINHVNYIIIQNIFYHLTTSLKAGSVGTVMCSWSEVKGRAIPQNVIGEDEECDSSRSSPICNWCWRMILWSCVTEIYTFGFRNALFSTANVFSIGYYTITAFNTTQ